MAALQQLQTTDGNPFCDYEALIGLIACNNLELRLAVIQKCIQAEMTKEELFKVVSKQAEIVEDEGCADRSLQLSMMELMGKLSIGQLLEADPSMEEGFRQLPGIDLDTHNREAPASELMKLVIEHFM